MTSTKLTKTIKWSAIIGGSLFALFITLCVGFGIGYSMSAADKGTTLSSTTEAKGEDSPQWMLFNLTNEERKKAGLNLLSYSPYLEASADDKCHDMVTRDYWAHNSPDGVEPWQFIKHYNIRYDEAAENLAYGYNDAEAVFDGWMNSESHKKNILDPDLTQVGFGLCEAELFQGSSNQVIVVQHFIAS